MNDQLANSTLINVCILPSEAVSLQCSLISQSLGTDTMFILGQGKFAHMTVYMARFSNDVVAEAIDAVKKSLIDVKPFHLQHSGYFMTKGRYLEASYNRSPELMKLHESIIKHTSGLRMNTGQLYEESYYAPFTLQQQKNAQETGYDLARDLYRPHITLTRYKVGLQPSAMPALPKDDLSFKLSNIGVYKADENGAVYQQLKTFIISM